MAVTTIGNNGTPGTSGAATRPAAPLVQGGASRLPAAKVPTVVPEPVPQQPQPDQVQKAVESLKQLIEAKAPNSLTFSIDDSTGKTVVKITDAETGEMIRQIPSEELLEIARSLDKMQGMLLQQQV